MKQFTITKTGYSANINGCSAEYFTAIISDSKGMRFFRFYGLYGSEERVEEAIKKLGYKGFYTSSTWGKCVRSDVRGAITEHTVLANIKELVTKGYIEDKK